MISMLERIRERHTKLEQQRDEMDKCQCNSKASSPPSSTAQTAKDEKSAKPSVPKIEKSSSHRHKERKESKEKPKHPPKVIYLDLPIDPVSPLHISRSLRSRKTREQESKKKETKKTQPSAVDDKETEPKADDGSCRSATGNQNDNSILNESWDLTSFLSGEVSFTQQVTTHFEGNNSISSKCHVASSRRGSVASSRRGSVASRRRGSVAINDENDSSMSSSVLDELEVRSKGTMKCRPSYSEIKGNVTANASKSLIRRYSIDNSNLLPGQPGSGADLPSCLKICEAKLRAPTKSNDQSLGVCYGIIDKYMMGGKGMPDAEKAIRRSQSYASDDRSSCDEGSFSSSSLVSSDSSKRVSMAPSDLKEQLKNAYQTKKRSKDPARRRNDRDGHKLPGRSKSDTSNSQPKGDAEVTSQYHSPKRTHSDGVNSSRGSLPGLPPELTSPRETPWNAHIFKKSPNHTTSKRSETKSTRERSRSKKSTGRSDNRSRRGRSAKARPSQCAELPQQQATGDTKREECMDYVPSTLKADQRFSRRNSTGQNNSLGTTGYPGSPQRRQSTGQNALYPVKDDDVRSYLETELNVVKPSESEDDIEDDSSDNKLSEENSKKKKRKKPRVSKAA